MQNVSSLAGNNELISIPSLMAILFDPKGGPFFFSEAVDYFFHQKIWIKGT